MTKRDRNIDLLSELTWKDLEKWAGHRIVTRGKSYHRRGYVSDLAIVDDKTLIASVDGTRKYKTKVTINKRGIPESQCSCPYMVNCKHGVAVVLEYLEWIENDKKIPSVKEKDSRMNYFSGEIEKKKSTTSSGTYRKDIEEYLKSRTKPQLVELIKHFMGQYPDIKKALTDQAQFTSGNSAALLSRVRSDVRDIDLEPDWEDQWYDETYERTDYSGIRKKLVTLVELGCADEVLSVGKELIDIGIQKVERTDDDGMTRMDIQYCVSVLVDALKNPH